MKNWIWIAALVALVVGCSGGDKAPPIVLQGNYGGNVAATTGGKRSTGGHSGTSVGGGGTVAGTGQVGGQGNGGANELLLAPTVEILAPQAVSNPDIGPVLVDLTVDVLCKVTKSTAAGATAIAGSTVKISLIPTTGISIDKSGVLANQSDGYTANFPLDKVANGPVSFSCTASDTSTPPHVGTSAIVTTFVDHGPTISGAIPTSNQAFPLKSSQHFEFNVTASPLAAGDQGAEVGDVTLKVNEYVYSIPPNTAVPGHYSVEVDFSDGSKFPQGLTGKIPVSITASNKRSSPGPVASTQNYYILLDGDPPTVDITEPAKYAVIGGQRTLKFSVTDTLSGVDTGLVFVNLGTDSSIQATAYQYQASDPAWSKASNPPTTNFTFAFDSKKFDTTDSQVTVSVKATDLAGNEATSTLVFYYLDNVPPFVSLDPPNIRLVTPDNTTNVYCSAPFDPVGARVPNAGTIINSFQYYRAFVWDRTNGKPSQSIFYYAGIDPTKVHLYLQPDPTKRVVYDKTGDGICDSIDDDVKSLPFQPNLDPVTETGSANQNPADFTTAPDVTGGFSGKLCQKNPNDPQPLCTAQASEMTVAVHQPYATTYANDAAIYALQVKKNDIACTGTDWDISNFIPVEGWVCLAAEAVDGVGNTGISAPIALCFDNELTASKPSCATGGHGAISTEKPPSCITDGCKPSSKSLVGDWDTTNLNYVPYDIGNPAPFYVQYN